MMMAGEFRHGTAVTTFLAAPKRASVLSAKLAVAALGGTVMMLVSTAVSLIAGYFVLLGFENAAGPSENLFVNTLLAAAISGAVLGIVGVAIGTLIRNQMIAIVGALVYLFVIDPLLLALWPDAGKYLPSGLISAMLSIEISAPELGFDTTQYLPPITATLVLLAYGAAFAAVAIATSLRRDID
jgi:ABC-type transport system involved in multi-copper enzyme maturation permease subunit